MRAGGDYCQFLIEANQLTATLALDGQLGRLDVLPLKLHAALPPVQHVGPPLLLAGCWAIELPLDSMCRFAQEELVLDVRHEAHAVQHAGRHGTRHLGLEAQRRKPQRGEVGPRVGKVRVFKDAGYLPSAMQLGLSQLTVQRLLGLCSSIPMMTSPRPPGILSSLVHLQRAVPAAIRVLPRSESPSVPSRYG